MACRNLRDLRSDRGVIIPLLAAITLGVLSILIILGVDATIVKYAGVDLRTEANDICQTLASLPLTNQREVALAFVNEVNDYAANPARRMRNLKATLIMPTQAFSPEEVPSGFDVLGQTADYEPPEKPYLYDGPTEICSHFGLPVPAACAGFCSTGSNNCFFQGDVNYSLSLMSNYPIQLAHNWVNAGNFMSCELEAEAETFWSAPQRIEARVSFWQPAVGYPSWDPTAIPQASPPFRFGNPPAVDEILPYPGLTIAIATEMTTDLADARFLFSNFSVAGASAWSGLNPSGNAFPQTFPGTSGLYPGPSAGDGSVEAVTASTFPEKNEFGVACMNPAILVRNLYTSTLLEFASRHGHFRRATEMLHINPQYRSFEATSAHTTSTLNFPSLISSFGQDIALRRFQIPYVFYHGGIEDDNDPDGPNSNSINAGILNEFGKPIGAGDRLADGYINPFVAASVPGPFGPADNGHLPQTLVHHSLLANQLRFCYHLYSGGGLAGYISRHLPVSGTSPDINSGFEPQFSTSSDPYSWENRLTTGFAGLGSPWGQECPWSGSCTPIASRLLGLAEVAAALGSTQSCPFVSNNGLPTSADCSKPALPLSPFISTYDLRPDLFATLNYIGRNELNPLPLTGARSSPTKIRAVKAPGLFRVQADDNPPGAGLGQKWPGLVEPNFPLGIANYEMTRSTSSSILIVLHQRLSNPARVPICDLTTNGRNANCACNTDEPIPSGPGGGDVGPNNEVCRIRCAVETLKTLDVRTGQFVPRPITVSYFPTNSLDASGSAITDLLCAFNASYDVGDSTKTNVLFPYTPYSGFPNDDNCDPIVASTEAECFNDYWEYLLMDGSQGIIEQARLQFLNRFTSKALKF